MVKLRKYAIGGLALLTIGCATKQPKRPAFVDIMSQSCNIKYVADPNNVDYWQTPVETAELGTGDCEDQAFYLENLLKKEGFESRVVWGAGNILPALLNNEPIEGHAWVEYEDYILDPTACSIRRRDRIPFFEYVPIESEFLNGKYAEYQSRLEGEQ